MKISRGSTRENASGESHDDAPAALRLAARTRLNTDTNPMPNGPLWFMTKNRFQLSAGPREAGSKDNLKSRSVSVQAPVVEKNDVTAKSGRFRLNDVLFSQRKNAFQRVVGVVEIIEFKVQVAQRIIEARQTMVSLQN